MFFFLYIYIYIYIYNYVVLLARISQNLSRHSSLSSIASGRSSRLHLVSVKSCCKQVLVGRSTLARLGEGDNRRISLMSSSLLLQHCLGCLFCLIWILLEKGGKWPYNWFVGCCFQDLFNIAHSILEQFPSSLCSIRFISVHVVHL